LKPGVKERMRQQGLFGPVNDMVTAGGWVRAEEVRLVRVAFEGGGDNLYDYAIPEELENKLSPGQRVRASLGKGNRQQVGFCVELAPETTVEKVKYIQEIVDSKPLVDDKMMELARWISGYYCCPLGGVLSAMVPAAVKQQVGMVLRSYVRLTEKGEAYLKGEQEAIRLSKQGREIMAWLKDEYLSGGKEDSESWWSLDEIREKLSVSKGSAQTLARQDLIEIRQKRELARSRTGLEKISARKVYFELNEDQQRAMGHIEEIIKEDKFQVVLLHGVTGSGKTEIYMRTIEKVIHQGKSVLVLVPEISLTPQMISSFKGRFGQVAVLHSRLTSPQRHQQWRWIAEGGVKVVVGARSGVFAPLPNLGLIVVDEEHEPSYKQDMTPRYHGRDVAIKRAQINGIPLILGSATPSLESLKNCREKKHYQLIKMSKRVLNLPLPKVRLVNMRNEVLERKGNHLLSRVLEEQLQRCLSRKKQAILLLNRRGHSNFLMCPSCQFILTCPNCDVSLTFHKEPAEDKSRSWVMCHYCTQESRVPGQCPVCGKKLILIGPGTQKAEEELRRKLPEARLQRMDSDSMRQADMAGVLADFGAGQIDILVGTQMIGKGLDYPNVELVGVLNADTALGLADFRSSERTFQLIAQVAGRCGRMQDTGRVVVQSFEPEEPAVKWACEHDYERFVEHELQVRQRCKMPPFGRLARIILRDPKLSKLEVQSKELKKEIDRLNEQLGLSVQVRGPVPAGIARIENYHRWEIILRAEGPEEIQKLLSAVRRECLPGLRVQGVVDVDPINLL